MAAKKLIILINMYLHLQDIFHEFNSITLPLIHLNINTILLVLPVCL